jgi:hypothetical protein
MPSASYTNLEGDLEGVYRLGCTAAQSTLSRERTSDEIMNRKQHFIFMIMIIST